MPRVNSSQITDLGGGLINGTGNAANTDLTNIIGAGGAETWIMATLIVVANSSSSNDICNLEDNNVTKLVTSAPANGGAILTMPTAPFAVGPNTDLEFTAGAGVTTMYVSAVGYLGQK